MDPGIRTPQKSIRDARELFGLNQGNAEVVESKQARRLQYSNPEKRKKEPGNSPSNSPQGQNRAYQEHARSKAALQSWQQELAQMD